MGSAASKSELKLKLTSDDVPGVLRLFGVFRFSSSPSNKARLSRFPDPEADVTEGWIVSKLRLSWGSASATCDSVSKPSIIILSLRSSVTVGYDSQDKDKQYSANTVLSVFNERASSFKYGSSTTESC